MDKKTAFIPSVDSTLQMFVEFITRKPFFTVLIVALLTSTLLWHAATFRESMTSDVEVYLPEGEETTKILLEVREEWSTDVMLIYVETDNAKYPYDPDSGTGDDTNITDQHVLLEMSRIEGDAYHGKEYFEGLYHGALDYNKDDRGKEDGIVFVLSIATVIKELNSSNPRFINAVERQFGKESGLDVSFDDEVLEDQGEYAIPDDQNRIDQYVDAMGETLESLAVDTNDDGIWDTGAIIIAIKHFRDDDDRKEMIDNARRAIDNRETKHTTMTATGLVVVLEDISQRVYDDLLKMVVLSFIFVIITMYFFHRTLKILVITAIPVLFSVIWSFGLLRVLDITLTPMVVAAGPILIGIGVDYSLHITNRIAEFNKKEKFIPSVVKAYKTTGRATMLCALTDAIGFSALLIPSLPVIGTVVSIAPMRTVGLTMILGVFFCFLFTLILTPPLMILLKYEKKSELNWKVVGKFPVKHKKLIIGIAIVLTLASLLNVSVMDKDIRGDEAAPEGIDSLEKIKEYTRNFEAGQTGMVIVRGDPDEDPEFHPIKDINLLDVVNETQYDIGQVRNTTALSVVNFFKAIKINFTLTIGGQETTLGGSLWDVMHSQTWTAIDVTFPQLQSRRRFIEVSYETLSNETRSMLINDGYTKTLIYTEMPYINLDDTANIVKNVNHAIDKHRHELPGDESSMSDLTGGAPVSLAINHAIKYTQWTTIFVSLVLVCIVLMILFGPKRGLLTLIPIVMVVMWQPLTMVGAGTNVNIFTAMLGTIIIGIGIDCAVHITERVNEEGWTEEGIAYATEHTGQTLVEATATTIAGVSAGIVISFWSFAGLRNFFLIITLLITYSLLAGLLVLPALYAMLVSAKETREKMAQRGPRRK